MTSSRVPASSTTGASSTAPSSSGSASCTRLGSTRMIPPGTRSARCDGKRPSASHITNTARHPPPPLQPFGLMHRREHDLLVFRPDRGHVLAGDRIRERDFVEKLIHILVAQRVLRELLEIVEPRLRVRELRPRVVAVAALDHHPDRLRRIVLHPFAVEDSEHIAKTAQTLVDCGAAGALAAGGPHPR